jgi:hypothetical protein
MVNTALVVMSPNTRKWLKPVAVQLNVVSSQQTKRTDMTKEEFEVDLIKVANIQRNAGWSDYSINSYAEEIRFIFGDGEGVLMIGAGLAQNNSRHGVKERVVKSI